ncbi:hypothetical protein BGW80DRAFT_1272067 [Lactifluus volemus]|nr:hypothetical protein BGW80DRAFT_1272067 [Lactifluus volemus]
MPVFGQFLQAGGAVFVDRGNSAVAVQFSQKGQRTSRPYHGMRPFKKGVFHLAVQAHLPLVPVVFENYWNKYHSVFRHFESERCEWILLRACSTLLTLFKSSMLPPISTDGLTTADVGCLSLCVREQMLQCPPPPPDEADKAKREQRAMIT